MTCLRECSRMSHEYAKNVSNSLAAAAAAFASRRPSARKLRTRSRSRTKHRKAPQARMRPKDPRTPARPGYSRRRRRTAAPSRGDDVTRRVASEGHAVPGETPCWMTPVQYGASDATALPCASSAMSLDRSAGRRSGNASHRRASFLPQKQSAGLTLAFANPGKHPR